MQDSFQQEKYIVSRISRSDELEALRTEWTTLIEAIPAVPLFLSWEWITTWWKSYQDRGTLWLLTVRSPQGALLGIIPLMLEGPTNSLLRLRSLSFLFDSPPVHMDVLAHPKDMLSVSTALLHYLCMVKQEWDVIDLRGLASNSYLKEGIAMLDGHFREREGLTCPYISLPRDWRSFEKESLSANRRKQIRSNQRRLQRDYPDRVVFSRVNDKSQIQPALDLLIDFNREKWRGKEGVSAFEDERYRKFNAEIASMAFDYGWLRFYELRVGQELLSSRLCFSYRGVFVDFQTAFNPEWAAYAPGELLLAYVLQDAIKEGAREFDFLPGTYRWKKSWSTGVRHESHIVFGQNWRSLTALVGASFLDRAVRTGRKVLPESSRDRINLLLSRIKHRDLIKDQTKSKLTK
jgi:CelD/BcsL family acetyltransferase involved in cellulose biosynthesis